MSKFTKVLAEMKEDHKNKKSQAEEARKRAKSDLLEKMQVVFDEFPELNTLAVIGYTPGFNDGDICRHSQCDVILNSDADCVDDVSEEVGTSELMLNHYANINSFTHLLSGLFELAFETNFKVIFARQDGKITMNQDWYDCGY